MFPKVISFYTKNTPYEDEAQDLIASCEKFGLEYEIDAIDSKGSWGKNCNFKSEFILEKLTKLKRPVLWVDSDAVFVKYPKELKNLSADFALCMVPNAPDEHPCKMITGTIYVNYTPTSIEHLKEWIEACPGYLDEQMPDQMALKDILLKGKAKVHDLSVPYFTTYDLIGVGIYAQEAVLVHFQASRLLKKVIDQEVLPFCTLDQITREKKKRVLECIP